jgi:hypothetical protein
MSGGWELGHEAKVPAPALSHRECHAYLALECGPDFADWLLGAEPPTVTARRQMLLDPVLDLLRARDRGPFDSPASRLAPLLWFKPAAGDTPLNIIQRELNPALQFESVEVHDETIDSLVSLSVRLYGEMLLRVRGGSFFNDYGGPELSRAVQAIAHDPELPFTDRSSDLEKVIVCSGSQDCHVELGRMPTVIIGSALNSLIFAGDSASLPSLQEWITSKVNDLRASCRGEETEYRILTSFTGVSLGVGEEVLAPGIRIRATRESDHPYWLLRAAERAPDEPEISAREVLGPPIVADIGQVLLETSLRVRASVHYDAACPSSHHRPETVVEARLEQAQLAAILALGSESPKLVGVWTRIDDLLTWFPTFSFRPVGPLSYSAPTTVSTAQRESWQEWLRAIVGTDMDCVGVAPRRLISAWSSRAPEEKLVDAVIVLEALCGGQPETVFRVRMATARLLEETFEKRSNAYAILKKIYQGRSMIVHGGKPSANVDVLAETAVEYARRALAIMITDRKDLLTHDAATRCEQLLLE